MVFCGLHAGLSFGLHAQPTSHRGIMAFKRTLAEIPIVVVHQHIDAPAKPALGEPCNGCGVCCLLEPCPLGVVISGHRTGACAAVVWSDDMRRYQCGMLLQPAVVLATRWPHGPQGVYKLLGWLLGRCAPRWISAGSGCDADLMVHKMSGDGAVDD